MGELSTFTFLNIQYSIQLQSPRKIKGSGTCLTPGSFKRTLESRLNDHTKTVANIFSYHCFAAVSCWLQNNKSFIFVCKP